MIFHRFSHNGFAPKQQHYHYRLLQEQLNLPDLTGLNNYQQQLQKRAYEKSLPLLKKLNLKDWEEGVFAFIDALPQQRWINQELNHLTYQERLSRTLFTAELPDTIDVYSVYGLAPEMYSAQEYLKEFGSGSACYLPKRSLLCSLPLPEPPVPAQTKP